MGNMIEDITADVLRVSRALRSSAPQTEIITVEEALAILYSAEQNLDPNRAIAKLAHELKFDIVEGNTKWRKPKGDKPEPATDSKLIQFIPR